MSDSDFKKQFEERKSNEYYSEELREYVEQYVDIVEEKINEAKAQDTPYYSLNTDLT